MAGQLTIYSNSSGSILSGHSWIEYTPNGGTAKTYGTWGNDPTDQGNGLFEDIEAGMAFDSSRSMAIDDAHEAALMSTIADYRARGADGWKLLSPCSTFASEAWEAGTDEKLKHRTGIISNPTKLKKSIEAANARTAALAAAPPAAAAARPPSSRRKCGSATQSCSKSSASDDG